MQTMLVVAGLLAASANTPVGFAVETTARGPNIDRLAAEGIDFHNAHAMAMCAPTRSQFKTCRAGKWLFGRMNPRERGIDESILFVNGYRLWDPHVVVYDSGGLYKKFNQPADLPTDEAIRCGL